MVHLRSTIFASILSVVIGPLLAHGQNIRGKEPAAQSSQGRSGVERADNPEVRSLLNDSEMLPAEFTSDISLTLVENGFVRNSALKAKIITRAFEKASAAQDDVMRRPFGASVEETSAGLHAIASLVTVLNRISLQARVVRQAVARDPRKARQLFDSMRPPQITPVSCNENWYFVPDAYYDALAAVLQRGFSEREIAGGNRAGYLSSVIRQTQSHVQVVPIARLLSAGDLTEQELRTIVPVYAATITDLHGDPLSFSILMSAPDSFFEAICLSAAHTAFGRECRFEYDPASVPTFYRSEGWNLPGIADFNLSATPRLSELPSMNQITGASAELLPHNEYPYIVEFPAQEFLLNGSRQRMRPATVKVSIVRWKVNGHIVAYSYGFIPVIAQKIGVKWHLQSEAGCIFTATFIDDKGDGVFRVLVPDRLAAGLIPGWAKPNRG